MGKMHYLWIVFVNMPNFMENSQSKLAKFIELYGPYASSSIDMSERNTFEF